MWRWAYRSFIAERASLGASAGGAAVVFLLVMIVEGAFRGEADQTVAFIENTDAPVWVMQQGVANMHMAASALGENVAADLRRVPGVAHVEGILYGAAMAEIGGNEQPLYLIGTRAGQRVRAWDLAAGRGQAGRGEIVLPEAIARRRGVGLGGVVSIERRRFRVVGLSRGTYSMANSLGFIHASDLASMFDVVADANHLLVWPSRGVAGPALAARIGAALPGVSVLERDTLIANDRALALQMGGALIGIMTIVAGVVAALIVAFTVFTFVARRARELAVAKAVGARGFQLLTAAAGQALGLGMLGYAIAVLFALALQPVFARFAPGVAIHFSSGSMLRLGLAALLVALAAGALPAWRVLRVDPTTVFSS